MKHNDDIDERLRLPSSTIYEIIATEGKEELNRPFPSLGWSGLVAGICITFSLLCEGFIKLQLQDGGNHYLIENLGYTAGFIIVILGRFQLFTENTITVVLPLLENFSVSRFIRTMQLWALVFACNLLGTFLVVLLLINFPFFSIDQLSVFIDISQHAVNRELGTVFFQAIPAGFLIAALVWMLPSSVGSQFWVIFGMTYIIAIGDFAHIIAGSAEVFLLLLTAKTSLLHGLGYLATACLGNIIGGTGLFALTAYAQVREEML